MDATFPVAKFARARMAERLPDLNSEKGNILPTSDKKKPTLDLLSKFLAAQETRPEFMTDGLVQTMAVSMAFAGSETTAISLGAVFYYLLRNPAAMARLRSELDEAGRKGVFHDNETGLVTWSEAQKLPYLDACIKEAFRVHPAPGLPMERIVPPQGAEIAGRFIPGGTIVGCSAWVYHRNKSIFGEDADVYRPERWLVDESMDKEKEEARIKEMTGTMLQFGMGSRTCIGKNISLLEIYKLVPSLLRAFDVSIPTQLLYLRSLICRLLTIWPEFRLTSKTHPRIGRSQTPGSSSSQISGRHSRQGPSLSLRQNFCRRRWKK